MKNNEFAPPPDVIPINRDDYHAKHIGTLADGRQFLLTNPFVPLQREFLALYIFNAEGKLLEAKIDDLGTREQTEEVNYQQLREARLAELGEFTFGDIAVAPFRVERFGVEFGLIPLAPEEDEDEIWWVELQPGNYMAFAPPWNGYYDT